jgi:hypothetical protein
MPESRWIGKYPCIAPSHARECLAHAEKGTGKPGGRACGKFWRHTPLSLFLSLSVSLSRPPQSVYPVPFTLYIHTRTYTLFHSHTKRSQISRAPLPEWAEKADLAGKATQHTMTVKTVETSQTLFRCNRTREPRTAALLISNTASRSHQGIEGVGDQERT